MSSSPRSDDAAPSRGLLATLFAGVFMAALDMAVVATALPTLSQSFGIEPRQASLLVVLYLMCALCSTPVLAQLGDRHGRRPVFLGSVACFGVGSLAVALAPDLTLLLAGRALQGLGAGGILPAASALVGDALAPRQRGRALGLLGATHALAFVVGPPLATLAMLAANWQGVFLINLPLARLVLVLGARSLPRHAAAGAARATDLAGLGLTLLLLSCLVLGITRIADDLYGLRLWPALLATAFVCLVALWQVERRAAAPLIPPSLLAQRQLALAYLLAAGSGIAMGGIVFLASMAQQAHGLAPRHAGLLLLPLVLSSMVGSVAAGRRLDRMGPRTQLLAGFVLLALGYAGTAFSAPALWIFLLATLPLGLGLGIVVGGALRAIALDEAPPPQRGAAQGLLNLFTSVGTLLAAALIGATAGVAGGGARGLALAEFGVALAMLAMLPAALALHRRPAHHLKAEPAA